MAKRTKDQMPKQIYVVRETDQNDPDSRWLMASDETTAIEHGAVVGVYELRETRRMKVSRELE
jgi:hypothetical protein